MPELLEADIPLNSLHRASDGLGSIPEPNNTLGQAYNIGVLSGTRSFTDFVGSSDTNDYYRFSLGTPSNINLALTGMSADADLQLLNSSGGLIQESRRSGSLDDSINREALAAGNYYVRVLRWSGDTNYRLSLSTLKPSNLLPVETNIGTLSGFRSFSDRVDTTDTADVFRFAIGGTRNVNLILTGMSADADLRLIRDVNSNGLVDSGDEIVRSIRGGSSPEWISRSLGGGTYFAQVYQWSGNTNYNLRLFALGDMGIGNLLQSAASDYNVSRNEMIGILRNAKDGGVIDSTELSELRTIVAETRPFMAGYVFNLSNKVVNTNRANQWWTNGTTTHAPLGNLFAGATATHMERLIGKWFLGLDRPSTAYQHQPVSGSLFRGGATYSDIRQGELADCYLLAMLAGTAFRSPSQIGSMFIDNGDNTWTVRFYNGGVADYVTVDRYLPTNSSGYAVFAGWGGGNNTNVNNELWVALAEKAYAQINESNWIGQSGTNEYHGIDFGSPLLALNQITARNTSGYLALNNFSAFLNAYNAGRIVSINTSGHAYTVVGYNSSTGQFAIYNPYGSTGYYTWSQIQSTFANWGYSTS
jgi:hypothetical protein